MYDKYIDRLKNVVSKSNSRRISNNGTSILGGYTKKIVQAAIQEQRSFTKNVQLSSQIQPLTTILNPMLLQSAKLGHPDFLKLKNTDDTEQHYIVTVFIDIMGSTNLFKKYELDEIYSITNTIQSAALHTCISLGGHIQRLQGDGVFAYFGGRTVSKKNAVEMAVTACSMFTYFMSTDLKKVFEDDEIENIKTRIGIDFGDDDEVLWANFGLLDISELTTLSLHTSLASKMQAYAPPNGIVVGQNIKDYLQEDEGMFDLVRDSKGDITKRYIFENPLTNFRYTQYVFNWLKFLKSRPYITIATDGTLHIITQDEAEKLRLSRLRNTTSLISEKNAFTNTSGIISSDSTGIQNKPHRFHYGE